MELLDDEYALDTTEDCFEYDPDIHGECMESLLCDVCSTYGDLFFLDATDSPNHGTTYVIEKRNPNGHHIVGKRNPNGHPDSTHIVGKRNPNGHPDSTHIVGKRNPNGHPDSTHIVGLSGGKDSTATLLIAQDRLASLGGVVEAVFVDTGNEHPETYAYLDYLEAQLGIKITRLKKDFTAEMKARRMMIARDQRVGRTKLGVKHRFSNRRKREALAELHPSGNPFLDMCLVKGMFPTNRTRFCTEYLKRDVFVDYVDSLVQTRPDQKVIIWQGIRRDESEKRKNAKLFERVGRGFYYFRPLIHYTESDVFKVIADHGLKPNPLYKVFGRVGCSPCIYSNKNDLRSTFQSDYGPEVLQKIRDWEARVAKTSKSGQAAFFHGKQISGAHYSTVHTLQFYQRHSIDAIRHWSSKPTRFVSSDWDAFDSFDDDTSCSSEFGLCG